MVARGKPFPDLFLYAAEQMGVAPGRCVVIEDSVPGVTAARAAGMPVLGFCGGGHWAHDRAGADLLAAGALRVFDEFTTLPIFWRPGIRWRPGTPRPVEGRGALAPVSHRLAARPALAGRTRPAEIRPEDRSRFPSP